jgi:hypothetical protein
LPVQEIVVVNNSEVDRPLRGRAMLTAKLRIPSELIMSAFGAWDLPSPDGAAGPPAPAMMRGKKRVLLDSIASAD